MSRDNRLRDEINYFMLHSKSKKSKVTNKLLFF